LWLNKEELEPERRRGMCYTVCFRYKERCCEDFLVASIMVIDDPSNDGGRGDILFRGLWKNQHETIVDIRVTDADANAIRPRSFSGY
jgi:hypothetical protein